MKPCIYVVLTAVSALCVMGCQRPGLATHSNVVENGLKSMPEVAQITNVLKEFPIHHMIAHFGFEKAKPTRWQSVVYMHERYTLIYSVTVHIDYTSGKVTGIAGPSEFFLMETVRGDARGGQDIGDQWRFDSGSWKKVNAAGGDFSAIGIMLKTNAPIPNWSELISFK